MRLRFWLPLLMALSQAPAAEASEGSVTPGEDDGFTAVMSDASAAAADPPPPSSTTSGDVTYVIEPACQGPYAPGETCMAMPCEVGEHMITTPIVNGVRDEEHAYGWCPTEQAAADPLPGAVARAFAEVPVPAAVLSIQPPKGKTLVGLEAIFSTTTGAFTRSLRLLGRRIELRITPSSFTWHHGDGTTQTTDWPGRAWDGNDDMDRYLTHTYQHTGTVHPSVTVTWSATWRIGNGPWRSVDGTVTKAGETADLTVVEAEPELVAP